MLLGPPFLRTHNTNEHGRRIHDGSLVSKSDTATFVAMGGPSRRAEGAERALDGPSHGDDAVELVIEAGKVEQLYWRDVWRYREMMYVLAWRDIVVRYKQTVIGVAWAVLRPLLTILVFTLVFHRIANLSSGTVPYVLVVAAAMLPWQFFATALSEASGSLLGNAGLVSKIYFPRLLLPASAVVTSLVDFAIALVCTLLLQIALGELPDWRVVALPAFTLLAFAAALGTGLWLAALNTMYRDFRFIVPFLVQFGLYVSPVGFVTTEVPARFRLLYALNPMVGAIDGFRWAMLRGQSSLSGTEIGLSCAISLTLLVSGVLFFRRMERTFADLI